jgi:DNA invertase Pin-like site-specific DNA recombinase
MSPKYQTPRFVSYIRVSTAKQGASGLGLDAQRHAISEYLLRISGASLVGEFEEVESGKNNHRPKLKEAMELADLTASTLVIAKLDRLSRNAHFLTGLADRGVKFVACDMPDANEFTVTIMAALAQQERKMISERTKATHAQIKSQRAQRDAMGKRPVGNPNGAALIKHLGNSQAVSAIKAKADIKALRFVSIIKDIKANGINTAMGIADVLNNRSIPTSRGKLWDAKGISRLINRLKRLSGE